MSVIRELESMGLEFQQCRGIMLVPNFVKIYESFTQFTCGETREGCARRTQHLQKLTVLQGEKVSKRWRWLTVPESWYVSTHLFSLC